jgi:hypothetical protein
MILYHEKHSRLMQWVIWYEEFMVKSWGARRGLPGMCPQISQPQAKVLWKEHVDA